MDHPFDQTVAVSRVAWGRVLRFPALAAAHLVTTRDVDVRAGAPGAQEARGLVARELGVAPEAMAGATQVHGCAVHVLRHGASPPASQPEADIVISDDPAWVVGVRVADCVPLLLFDVRTGAVAAAHAGWRGTCLGVARRTVEALARAFGSRPSDLVAAIGPCIGPDAYEVGDEVVGAFHGEYGSTDITRWFRRPPGRKAHLDLWTATRDQLVASGVPDSGVSCARACTFTHRGWFFSHRGEGGSTGRLLAAIRAVSRV